MTRRWSELAARVGDLFFPRVCPCCGKRSDRPDRHVCWTCSERVELYAQALCSCCGLFVEGRVGHAFVCGGCRSAPPAFDRARAAGRFSGILRELIHAFKYEHALWLKQDLSDLLEGCLQAHFEPAAVDAVVPVPLHPSRERERSYNQAALLAQELARRLDRRYDGAALVRARHTETQTHLDAARRRLNMRGAFRVGRPEWVVSRNVLLVDDVMTTGATLDACARALKQAGARKVWAVTVGRG